MLSGAGTAAPCPAAAGMGAGEYGGGRLLRLASPGKSAQEVLNYIPLVGKSKGYQEHRL